MRRWITGLGVMAIALMVAAAPAAAQQPWAIERLDVLIDVGSDGTLQVAEHITVLFNEERRGIFREIPVHYDLALDTPIVLPDPELTPADYVRVYEVTDISVSSQTAPDEVAVTDPGLDDRLLRIRIGEEDTWITGRHSYVIRYTVRGALNPFDGRTELYWNAVGSQWEVPIERASATVTGPGIQDTACFQGPSGADRLCDGSGVSSDQARFTADGLPARSALTIVVAFDPAAVEAGTPILAERFDLARGFAGSDAAVPLAVLVALLAFVGIGILAFREGRDREVVGGVTADGHVREERRRPLFARRTVPVQFRPPDGLRPAQLGVIVDERVDPVDVSATIVDLAVRGYLRIREVQTTRLLFLTETDHVLERLADPPDGELTRYEQKLLDALFETGDEVELSELRGDFHSEYVKVGNLLYEDARSRRWFARSPQTTRSRWVAIGIASSVVSVVITIALVRFTRLGIVGVPLILASVGLIVLHRWMPHRTVKGSQLLVQTLGFKEFIVTAESGRMDFAEQEHLFLEYLPYAVVFGATDKWARAFADLGVAAASAASGWYVSHHGGFGSLDGLSRSLNSFSSAAGSGLSTAPSSSGSSGFSGGGFSGGGGGGGGGGSW